MGGVAGGRNSGKKKVSVLYWSVQNYFDCPASTGASMERLVINPERRFHQLI